MSLRQQKAFKALAVFLAFSFAQVYVQTSLAGPGTNGDPLPIPQQFVARLTIRGGGSITVNGASAGNGATVLTGATLETPDQVGATLDLGPLGTVELEPNSKLQIDFDANGNVRIKLLRGCAVVKKKGKGEAEVMTAEGASEKADRCGQPGQTEEQKKRCKALGFCYVDGKLNPFNGVGVPGTSGGGLSTAAKVAIFGGGGGTILAIVILANRGHNPSP